MPLSNTPRLTVVRPTSTSTTATTRPAPAPRTLAAAAPRSWTSDNGDLLRALAMAGAGFVVGRQIHPAVGVAAAAVPLYFGYIWGAFGRS